MKDFSHFKEKIREISDFPTSGISFKDITPLLEDAKLFKESIDAFVEYYKDKKISKVIGVDARGFLLAAPIAYAMGAGLVIVRKKGKLPHEILREFHELEYGRTAMEIHADAIQEGERVIIIDDVLATGGTAGAAVRLVESLKGNIVGLGFLLELTEFPGREKLGKYDIYSQVFYT